MVESSYNNKNRLIAALVLNLAVIVFELIGFSLSFSRHGWQLFQFYTEDSNLLSCIACAAFSVCAVRCLHDGVMRSRSIRILRYASVCCVALTFLVVVAILAPAACSYGVNGYKVMLLTDSMVYMHLICPVLSVFSFLVFETGPLLTKKDVVFGLLPTVVYAVIVYTLNIVRVLEGPYMFFYVYRQPVYISVLWFLLLLAVSIFLSVLFRRLSLLREKKTSECEGRNSASKRI